MHAYIQMHACIRTYSHRHMILSRLQSTLWAGASGLRGTGRDREAVASSQGISQLCPGHVVGFRVQGLGSCCNSIFLNINLFLSGSCYHYWCCYHSSSGCGCDYEHDVVDNVVMIMMMIMISIVYGLHNHSYGLARLLQRRDKYPSP